MDQKWKDRLTRDEGERLKVYDDATGHPVVPGYTMMGHPTIGIGRALDVHGISDSEARYLFADDVNEAEATLEAVFDFYPSLSDGRKFVLVSMAFNLGWGGLLSFRQMLAAMRRGAWHQAATELRDSRVYRQLTSRYEGLAQLLENGS